MSFLFQFQFSVVFCSDFVVICIILFHFVPFDLLIHTLQPQFVKRECSVNAFDYSSRVESSSSFIEMTMQFISGAYKLH